MHAAQVGAAVAKPAVDRDLFGREFEKEALALVRACRVTLAEIREFVRDHDPGNALGAEHAGHPRVEDIHVADERHPAVAALPHPHDELVDLARIVANLVDEEPRAGRDLLLHLEELRNDLVLVELEIGDNRTGEKFCRVEPHRLFRRGARHIEPGVHPAEQREQADRVDVEHRLRAAADAVAGIVAAEHKQVVETLAGEVPRLALQRVAVEILARKVDHHLAAGRLEGPAQRGCGEHGIAAGVVGDRHPVDARRRGEILRKGHRLPRARLGDGAAGRDQLHPEQKILRALKSVRQRGHGGEAATLPGRREAVGFGLGSANGTQGAGHGWRGWANGS